MTRPEHPVADRELAVLEALWEHGPSTMRQLAERLYPDSATSQVSTVQKLLERLGKKRYVERRRGSGPQRFEAVVEREALIDFQLRDMAERFCGGSLTPLFSRLIQSSKLSAEELAELRALIERADESTSTRRRES